MSQKTNITNIDKIVHDYYAKQLAFKSIEEGFTADKKQFYEEMENYFHSGETPIDKLLINSAEYSESLIVTRIQKVGLKFDVNKLESVLAKEQANDVIIKRYEIINMPGLINYLKKFGIDPTEFKSFINTTKEVNQQALNQMEELGKIQVQDLKGTFTATKQDPYFMVKKVSGKKGGNA